MIGMIYKGARVAVEIMNNLAGVLVVMSWQGGCSGGRQN